MAVGSAFLGVPGRTCPIPRGGDALVDPQACLAHRGLHSLRIGTQAIVGSIQDASFGSIRPVQDIW